MIPAYGKLNIRYEILMFIPHGLKNLNLIGKLQSQKKMIISKKSKSTWVAQREISKKLLLSKMV